MARLLTLTAALSLHLACSAPDPDALWPGDEDTSLEEGALPELRAYSGGACPDLEEAGPAFETGDDTRSFLLFLPEEPNGAGVLFGYHGTVSGPLAFGDLIDAVSIAREHGLIVVLPRSGRAGNGLLWGTPPNDPTADVTFFDDLLACLSEQFDVDRRRVYVTGFSAGGMWASWLLMNRSTYLAAGLVFSAGVDAEVFPLPGAVNPYRSPTRDVPVLLSHGAPDLFILNFERAATAFARQLRDDGHTAIRCPHDAGHDVPEDVGGWAWDFLGAHRLDGWRSPFLGRDPLGVLPETCAWR